MRRAMSDDSEDAEDANTVIVRLCRSVLDKVDESTTLTESRRQLIADALLAMAREHDSGSSVDDDLSELADTINRWS